MGGMVAGRIMLLVVAGVLAVALGVGIAVGIVLLASGERDDER